jgi:hypothetical protein
LVKREGFLVLELKGADSKHLSSQLQVLNLGFVGEDANIFELAVNYVEYSFIPLFATYKNSPASQLDNKKSGQSNQGLDNVQKDLMQLKVHLSQCLQNLEIP